MTAAPAGYVAVIRRLYDAWKRGEVPGPLELLDERRRASGAEVEGRESALFTFRAGKVARYEWFHGEADAFEALRR